MKIKLILFPLLLFSGYVFGQEYIIRVKKQSSKYFYVNEKGLPISGNEYSSASDFCKEGVAIVSDKKESGFKIINTDEEIIETNFPLNPIINEWTGLQSGFIDGMLRTQHNFKIGAFNTKGILCVPVIYNKLTDFNNNHAIGIIDEKHFVVKNNGDQIELKFKKIKSFKRFSDGLAPIKIGKNWGFIDTLGQIAITPRFKSVGYFFGGLAWAKTFGLMVGFIDKIGNWVVQPKYTFAMNYDSISGFSRVKSMQTWGYVDKNGEFKTLGIRGSNYDFSEGLAIKKSQDKVGYINNKGEWVLKPVFSRAYQFINGFAKVQINTKLGLIDIEGKWLISPIYTEIGHAVKLKE